MDEGTESAARGPLTLVLFLGVALRLGLALVNRQANDDHLPVVRILADEGRAVRLGEVWESFQPKLYHLLVAGVWTGLDLRTEGARIVAAQLVSCVASVVTLLVLRRFLVSLPLDPRACLLVFALLTLSPGLIAIGAQATNDALVIALGTLAVDAGFRFLAFLRRRDFWGTTLWAALAPLAKGTGFVVVIAVPAILLVQAAFAAAPRRTTMARHALLFLLVCLGTAALLGPYREVHRAYGSPLANPAVVDTPWPDLVARTEVFRPGVRSVTEALLTFRFLDLLQHPMVSNTDELREISRTSLWSQLYGRASFSRYASHPSSWVSNDPRLVWLGRGLLLLAIVPAALLALGLVRALVRLARWLHERCPAGEPAAQAFLAVVAWGSLAMVALYALRLRDFSGMKEIFVYPGLLAFAALLAAELDRLTRLRWPIVFAVLSLPLLLLCVGFTFDVLLLILHLAAGKAA